MHASYLINLQIVEAGKRHTVGECESLVLPVINDADGVKFGYKSSKETERILLSINTVARRIDEMCQWVQNEVIRKIGATKFFLVQLDEFMDLQWLSHLLVFVCYMWNNEPHGEVLFCKPIIQGTSEEILQIFNTCVKMKALDWMKCVGMCMDSSQSVYGKNNNIGTQVCEISLNVSWTGKY